MAVSIPILQIDAFTSEPFKGNPAAVCLLAEPQDETWMQHIAAEMNLSETAFVTPRGNDFGLRWFTPTTEVDLCGHATLASAHALWEEGWLDRAKHARFHTRSGELGARLHADWIEMDFPVKIAEPAPPPGKLLSALGAEEAEEVRFNGMDYLVVLRSAARLRQLAPDAGSLATIAARGCIVTAPSDRPPYDFLSRFFAPRVGIAEDPVTGSAHCALGPYWAGRLGKTALTGYQASSRGGVVRMSLAGDGVVLSGQAVTVVHGRWVGPRPSAGAPD